MIKRHIATELVILLAEYPVITILGPRQAGKTTLAKEELRHYKYANLENPETRQFATDDPKGFLARFEGDVVLDEIQRVPELLSYIQTIVDTNQRNGQFVLTGSHQLALREAITQSLAGRTAILNLFPLSINELAQSGISFSMAENYIYHGFLPRIYDRKQRPTQAWSNYYQTYIERDVRQLINLKDFSLFEKFMKLLAGRVGQLMDYTSLANDVGVTAKTIKHWLSILEASFVVYKLPPYFENFGKRVVKSPNLYFFRDSNGNEVDILFQNGRELTAIEVNSSATYKASLLKGLKRISSLSPQVTGSYLVYSGDYFEFSDGITALKYNQVSEVFSESV